MMSLHNWPYKWFGFWSEMGERYSHYPSIKDWIKPDISQQYGDELAKILNYLRSAPDLVVTSACSFPHPITGGERTASVLAYQTDNTWLWLDDLPDYIEHNQVVLPISFYKHIQSNNFNLSPFPVTGEPGDYEHLDWP